MTTSSIKTEKTHILRIKTPEGITFSLQLASPVSRFLALSIDVATVSVVMSLLQIVLAVFGFISLDLAYAMAILLYFLVSIGYAIFFEWYWQGQTLGKKHLVNTFCLTSLFLLVKPWQCIL